MEEKNLITLGYFTKPRGLRGEIRLMPVSSNPQNILSAKKISVKKKDGSLVIFEIKRASIQGRFVIMNLIGINTIEKAEELRESEVVITEKELSKLPNDTFYHFDLEGLEVISDTDEKIGKVLAVHEYPTCDTLEVERLDGKVINIPMLKDVVLLMNIAGKEITVSKEKLEEFL